MQSEDALFTRSIAMATRPIARKTWCARHRPSTISDLSKAEHHCNRNNIAGFMRYLQATPTGDSASVNGYAAAERLKFCISEFHSRFVNMLIDDYDLPWGSDYDCCYAEDLWLDEDSEREWRLRRNPPASSMNKRFTGDIVMSVSVPGDAINGLHGVMASLRAAAVLPIVNEIGIGSEEFVRRDGSWYHRVYDGVYPRRLDIIGTEDSI